MLTSEQEEFLAQALVTFQEVTWLSKLESWKALQASVAFVKVSIWSSFKKKKDSENS